MTKRVSKWFFFAGLAGLAVLIVTHVAFPDHQISLSEEAAGCYWHKDWFDEVRCQNMVGAEALGGFFTGLQWLFVYAPLMFLIVFLRPDVYGSAVDAPLLFLGTLAAVVILVFALYWPFTKLRALISAPHPER